MTPTDKKISRRDFVRGVGGIGLLSAFPTIIPSSAFGANEAIRIGHIGVKNRGMQNLFPLMKHTVAVCDVDRDVLAERQGEGREGRPVLQGLRRLPQAARRQGHRRGRRHHARPLARADHDRRLRGGQGRVLREAADA